jgi:hypothetical protein
MKGLRSQVVVLFLLALVAEVATSWWQWVRAPTDTLRVRYGGSFLAFEIERFIPWLIILMIAIAAYLVLRVRYKSRPHD